MNGASGFVYDSILEENRSHTDKSGKKNHFDIVDLINQMFRKKLFITLAKDGKVDFIPDRYRDYCSGRERLYLTLNTAWAKGNL